MKRNYNFYIKDILQSILQIESFVEGMHYEGFLKDDKTASAVIRKLEIIGEAAKHVPTRTRRKQSWRFCHTSSTSSRAPRTMDCTALFPAISTRRKT